MTRQIRKGGKGSKAKDEHRQHWRTPPPLVRYVVETYDPDVDAAANASNAIVCNYFGPGGMVEDALSVPWLVRSEPTTFFVNPPFSSFEAFADRAIEATRFWHTSVLLGPISTDTRWFRKLVAAGAEIVAIVGRVHFLPPISLCNCPAQAAADIDSVKHFTAACDCDPDDFYGEHELTCASRLSCPFGLANKSGPGFPSALYVLRPSHKPRRAGAPVPFKLLDGLHFTEV